MPRARSISRSRWAATPLLVMGSAALIAACGSSSSTSGGTQPASSSTGGSSGTTVTATETDFHIALFQQSFQPGPYTFRVTNSGKFAHALSIDGPGVSNQTTKTLTAGQSGTLAVALEAGDYTLFCPVDGHRDKGMLLHITVGGAGAPTTSTTAGSGSGSGGGY